MSTISNIKKRALSAINLDQYSYANEPDEVGHFDIKCPYDRQYILRCLVKSSFSEFKIPDFLSWLSEPIKKMYEYQVNVVGVKHLFCYVTVRHGEVTSRRDDEWHVDGFSMSITHIPEQNYIYSDHTPTEYIVKPFVFQDDFDPLAHNIHWFFQDRISKDDEVKVCKPKTFYVFDPYMIHRRPPSIPAGVRTFIRISFTPIEINDRNNTLNPLIPTNYTRDGLVDFRNKLKWYGTK